MKDKIFQDIVHGYIKIPGKYCKDIIDTPHFQRLKRIEQTSMRCLYPCARHDRFIHSLGTYHIGCQIFNAIKSNSSELPLDSVQWETLETTYQLACLLHDCGHSPFSHTFEKKYDHALSLNDLLKSAMNDPRFSEDLDISDQPKEHEIISSYLLLELYASKLSDYNADPALAARMIIGCKYENPKSEYEKIANCFISLLNGHIIDADRLDYVNRDKFVSGYVTANVDMRRLLSSVKISHFEETFVVCFKKIAIGEIQNMLDIKDFQYTNVINHHKIIYDQYILTKAVDALIESLGVETQDLFNVNSFMYPVKVAEHYSIYLPSDDDIVHLLKSNINENEFAQEWFSRQCKLHPLWKTYAEFNFYFKELLSDPLMKEELRPCIKDTLEEEGLTLDNFYISDDLSPRVSTINPKKVYIEVGDHLVSYDELNMSQKILSKNATTYFYAYIPQEMKEKSLDIIKLIVKRVFEKQQGRVIARIK